MQQPSQPCVPPSSTPCSFNHRRLSGSGWPIPWGQIRSTRVLRSIRTYIFHFTILCLLGLWKQHFEPSHCFFAWVVIPLFRIFAFDFFPQQVFKFCFPPMAFRSAQHLQATYRAKHSFIVFIPTNETSLRINNRTYMIHSDKANPIRSSASNASKHRRTRFRNLRNTQSLPSLQAPSPNPPKRAS